jgi:hypothetical protein
MIQSIDYMRLKVMTLNFQYGEFKNTTYKLNRLQKTYRKFSITSKYTVDFRHRKVNT